MPAHTMSNEVETESSVADLEKPLSQICLDLPCGVCSTSKSQNFTSTSIIAQLNIGFTDSTNTQGQNGKCLSHFSLCLQLLWTLTTEINVSIIVQHRAEVLGRLRPWSWKISSLLNGCICQYPSEWRLPWVLTECYDSCPVSMQGFSGENQSNGKSGGKLLHRT